MSHNLPTPTNGQTMNDSHSPDSGKLEQQRKDWRTLAAMARGFSPEEVRAFQPEPEEPTETDVFDAAKARAAYEAIAQEAETSEDVELPPSTERALRELLNRGVRPTLTNSDPASLTFTADRCPLCVCDTLTVLHIGDAVDGHTEIACGTCDNNGGPKASEALGLGSDDLEDSPFVAPVEEPAAEDVPEDIFFENLVRQEERKLKAIAEAKRRVAEADRPERKSLLDHVLSFKDLADIQPPTPLIDHFIFRNTLTMYSAAAGSYKSFVALSQACALATGRPWMGQEVRQREHVVYVAAEGVSGVRARVQAWCDENGVDVGELDGWLYILPMPIQLKDPADVEDAIELVRATDAGMLILDTRARCTVGFDENSATDQGIAIETLERIQHAVEDCTVYVIHHGGKNGSGPRGSTAWDGQVWSDLRGKGKDLMAEIECHKHKDSESQCFHLVTLKTVVIPEEQLPGWTEAQRTTLVVTGEVRRKAEKDSGESDFGGLTKEEWQAERKAQEKADKERQRAQAELAQLHGAMEVISKIIEGPAGTGGDALTGRGLEDAIKDIRLRAEEDGKSIPEIGRPLRERALDRLVSEGFVVKSDGPRNSKLFGYAKPFRTPRATWAEMADEYVHDSDD